jgi:hypothetical protein
VAVPAPSLTLTITPPGGSPTVYTTKMAYAGAAAQMAITQNFGRQGDTATIPLLDDWQTQSSPSFYIPVESQILLYDNLAATTLFAGVVTDPALHPQGPNLNEWSLACTDYTYYADNCIVHGTWNGLAVDRIIELVTAQGGCGITATATGAGGFVTPAPVITQVNLGYQKLSDAWKTLAQLASSSTPYGWYVDQNLALHFFDATTALSSGATFTTTPTAAGAGSFTEGHVALDGSFSYAWDGTSIRNRVLIQGANQTIRTNLNGAPTDTFLGNGFQTSWALRFTVTGTPVLYVNGVLTTLQVQTGGNTVSSGWAVQQNAYGGWFLANPAAPATGWVMQIWYNYQVPVIAQANDVPSQLQYTGPNGGVFTEYINDSSLATASMALARAMRERTEYAFAAERISFTATEEFLGWVRAGETFGFSSTLIPDSRAGYSWGMNAATFLCISNSVTFGAGGYRRASISGVRI